MMKFFKKNWLPYHFNNSFLEQKTLNKSILIHLDKKWLLFPLAETVIKIRKNPILKR